MTTTTFRKNSDNAVMAADSRVSFIDSSDGSISWKDFDDYLKAVTYNDVLYGFAGVNLIYEVFLDMLSNEIAQDTAILDTLVKFAQMKSLDFMIMRYDGELSIFGYLTECGSVYNSGIGPIPVEQYGIGSGANCSVYHQNKDDLCARFPIGQIIATNNAAIEEATKNTSSFDWHKVCSLAGGDNGTGGEIKMTAQQTEKDVLQQQIQVLRQISGEAKANNSYAVCSMDAAAEKEKLDRLGVKPNTEPSVPTKEQTELFEQINKQFKEELTGKEEQSGI